MKLIRTILHVVLWLPLVVLEGIFWLVGLAVYGLAKLYTRLD